MKRKPYLNYTRLPMENAYNVRELGGYATKKGSVRQYIINFSAVRILPILQKKIKRFL